MIKMMMAAAGLSLGLLMMPVDTAPAQAGVDININIGGKGRISCSRGRRIVQNAGYWDVRTRNCGGRYYTYIGRRNNNRAFIITVDSRRGYITDVDRIRW